MGCMGVVSMQGQHLTGYGGPFTGVYLLFPAPELMNIPYYI